MPTATLPQAAPSVSEKSFSVRCFVYKERRTGLYVAECIDLDLIVKDRKANRAVRELRDAVLGYVRVSVESGEDSALIPRPSPLTHRIHYHTLALASKFALRTGDRFFACTPIAHTRCYA